jgi:hypothetical protein
MSDTTKEVPHEADWNVLTSSWLEVMTTHAEAQVCSPLDVLARANTIRCLALASPLDLFATHRFLLTLLYWKSDEAGGVKKLRASLLRGKMPRRVLDAIKAEAHRFRLFDQEIPFLQDTSTPQGKKEEKKSAGSLFAEFACGSNVAHFHHGDDKKVRLCVPCATIGMLRVVPWTQSGGAGLTPSVHNAPPIMALASGSNMGITLGLNLVTLSGKAGTTKWTGHFEPSNKDRTIHYLEAFTWNPRRIRLPSPESEQICWRCGQVGIAAMGQIVYLKNERTNKREDKEPFEWQDPAAFYVADAPYITMKSRDEAQAANIHDIDVLADPQATPKATVVVENPKHEGWHLIIPCTNPANNKTFDHRRLDLPNLSPDTVRAAIPPEVPHSRPQGSDGWVDARPLRDGGAARFLQTAVSFLSHADWGELSNAAYKDMHDSPAAFDLFSGLYWGLRDRRAAGLPSKNVLWLIFKLMAAVPHCMRLPRANATFCPLSYVPKRQIDGRYPRSFPQGRHLEASLRSALDRNMRKREPENVDWAGLCHGLNQLLD